MGIRSPSFHALNPIQRSESKEYEIANAAGQTFQDRMSERGIIMLKPKLRLTILMFTASLLLTLCVLADEKGDYSYKLTDDFAAITKYNGTEEEVRIPETLEGKPVKEIYSGSFADNKVMRTLTIPSTVTYLGGDDGYDTGAFQGCVRLEEVVFSKGKEDAVIGHNCFKNCTSLRRIDVPGNYTVINYYAFSGCTMLESVTWARGKYSEANQSIGDCAFLGCSALKEVCLPVTVHTIGESAFKNCTSLHALQLSEGLKSINEGAFAGCTSLIEVDIPSAVTYLGGNDGYDTGAFQGCTRLETLTFHVGEEDAVIGHNCFAGCESLKELVVPGNYKSINYYAFSGDISLTYFEWKKSNYVFANQTLGSSAFSGCTALQTVLLPDTLKNISAYCFSGCTDLSFVILEEGLEEIDVGAFSGCSSLETIVLPSTITYIGGNDGYDTGAFEGCKRLKQVWFLPGKNDAVLGHNSFKNCPSLTQLYIPGNYTKISYYAFSGARSLNTMWYGKGTYGYNNQSIENSAFGDCESLTYVSLPETIDSIHDSAFPDQMIQIATSTVTMDQEANAQALQAMADARLRADELRKPDEDTWTCINGHTGNTGNFCPICGAHK